MAKTKTLRVHCSNCLEMTTLSIKITQRMLQNAASRTLGATLPQGTKCSSCGKLVSGIVKSERQDEYEVW